MSDHPATVYVVDDDPEVREGLGSLIRSMGLEARAFGSANEFLAQPRAPGPTCLVLDIMLPGLSGLDLQRALATAPDAPPIIFITGHGDIPMSVRAMKGGAVEFLTKPFDDELLVEAIDDALTRVTSERSAQAETTALHSLSSQLTPREREVAVRVVRGMLNKQIAAELSISEVTVKVHRRNIMRKLNVRSVPDLVRMAARMGLDDAGPGDSP